MGFCVEQGGEKDVAEAVNGKVFQKFVCEVELKSAAKVSDLFCQFRSVQSCNRCGGTLEILS